MFRQTALALVSPAASAACHSLVLPIASVWQGLSLDRSDTGFDIGWAHAQWGVVPPDDCVWPDHPVRQGWEAGRQRIRRAGSAPSRATLTWLSLRLAAWREGRVFETLQVTPHFLAQLETDRCPVTRQFLVDSVGDLAHACVTRVCESAGYAAGHLAMLSQQALAAKAGLAWEDALGRVALAAAQPDGLIDGLSAGQWQRLATLMSFVTPLPHEVAAALPLAVLPPNRLRLLNPIQGLQAVLTLQFTRPGWSRRLARMAELLPAGALRRDFHLVVHSLLPRAWDGGRPVDPQQLRDRLEDAWLQAPVLRRWQRLARQLSPEQAEQLVARASEAGWLGKTQRVRLHSSEQAVDGWALESQGLAAPGSGEGVQGLPLGMIQVRQGVEAEQGVAAWSGGQFGHRTVADAHVQFHQSGG